MSSTPPALPGSDDDSARYRPDEAASHAGSSRFTFNLADETDLVTPEQRAAWEGDGGDQVPRLRPVLTDNGRKGPVSGAQWPSHEIGDLLGEGGMAAVYLARRKSDGRLVALKILPARFADDAASRKRFEREAQLSALIDNKHVVKVSAAGRFGPLCWLEMEYVDGTSLGDDLKRRRETADKPFTPAEVIDLGMQAADGLVEAAKHQLVHRDIKPGNLMRTREGMLKIADFGIVKVIGEEALTMAGTALGTPSYMSPEQGRGDQVDTRSDIYSLGVVLYELLTLKQPFEEATADALIYQHHFVEPKLITELVPDCDPHLQAVVFKCLQKYPEHRYTDAGQLVRDLDLIRHGHPPEVAVFPKNRVTTGADAALARHGGGWRRWWKHALTGVAGFVLLVALAVWWLVTSRAQAESLRTRLAVLDAPQAVPVTAVADLARLSGLVGDRDPQVTRWTTKLSSVEALRTRLAGFPAGALDHAQVADATQTLAAYQELCGTGEPLVATWRARLDDAARELRSAREALAVLDRSEVVPKETIDRLRPALATAVRLAGTTDAEAVRWTALLATADQRLGELRARLVVLDSDAPVTAALQRSGRDDLARWTVLLGAADEDGIRWAAKLQAAQERLASLRQALGQLDAGAIASLAVAAKLDAEWQAFTALADAEDVDLVRWRGRLDQARDRRAALVKTLAVLDSDTVPDADTAQRLSADLLTYRAIAGSDDAAAIRWHAALVRLTQERDTQLQVLTTLLDKQELTQEEQHLLRTTASVLRQRGHLEVALAQRVDERLARDEARLLLLVQRLAVLNRQEDVDADLRPLLEQFERLAALDDPRRTAWRQKLDAVVDLRRRLAALDERQPLAPGAAGDLERLTTLVGPAPADVRRWHDHVSAVTAHKQVLAALDQVAPVDTGADVRLERLRTLVGDGDADVQRWQARLDRITVLRGRLAGLGRAVVLPDGAAADATALAALIGADDPLVRAAQERVRILSGPPRPRWASAFGRDVHGLYADLTIWGRTQRFRYIPAGVVVMGSPSAESGRDSDEAPVTVRLTRSYWLADSEVTQELWAQVMLANPAWQAKAGHPVERVSWEDAQRFVALLAKRVDGGVPCRLPSEAEWEHAARAGASGRLPGNDATGGDDLDRIAVHAANSGGASRAVRSGLPNRLGLYDLLGNVWEWCQDSHAPYPIVPVDDPLATQGGRRVVRGGSWGDQPALLRVADRHALAPDVRSAYVGLRLAIAVEWGP